jgi:hypothetical protein
MMRRFGRRHGIVALHAGPVFRNCGAAFQNVATNARTLRPVTRPRSTSRQQR